MSLDHIFTVWLREQSMQVTLVFALWMLIDMLLARIGSVRLRTALWAAFLVKLALPPSLGSPVSIVNLLDVPVLAGLSGSAASTAPASNALGPIPLQVGPVGVVLLGAWALGFFLCVLVAGLRVLRARAHWSLREDHTVPRAVSTLFTELAQRAGLTRTPVLSVRADIDSGACVGLWSPRIVVPLALLAPERRAALEHVLLHELFHAKRRDSLRNLIWTAARCVYWFHPLVHVAARRAALLREMSCDELAAAASRDGAAEYRRTLLDMARSLIRPALTVDAFTPTGGQIVARLERLARAPRPRSRLSGAAAGALFLVLCTCCLPLGRTGSTTPAAPLVHDFADVPLDDLQGCLRKRYAVLAELARQTVPAQTP